MTKPNYDDLSDDTKLMLLDWIREGLYAHAKHAVGSQAYHQMILDMQGVKTFDIREIYERLHEKTVGHVVHAAKYEILIDEERDQIMRGELDPEVEENEPAPAPEKPEEEPAPAPAPAKPKRKKRCKGA